jgi:hypothetical protein
MILLGISDLQERLAASAWRGAGGLGELSDSCGIVCAAPAWAAEIGVAAPSREIRAIIWLGRKAGKPGMGGGSGGRIVESRVGQLILNIGPGRYRAEYLDPGSGDCCGVETASGSTLALAPPDRGTSLIIIVLPLFSLTKP